MSGTKSYKVLLADDHALFLSGLRELLNRRSECEVVGTATDGIECLELMRTVEYDAVLMDIDMPNMNGIEATRRAVEENPDAKIIALSMHGDEEFYFRMVEVGAKGFILKDSDIDEVIEAICTVCEGSSYFSKELLDSLLWSLRSNNSIREEDALSEREKEILILICKGFSNQEIADSLYISKRTVDNHRANILEKSGCRNTANLVVWAIKHALVEI